MSFFIRAWRLYLHENKPCTCDPLSIGMTHIHAFDFMHIKCCYAKMIFLHSPYLVWISLPYTSQELTYQEERHQNKPQYLFYQTWGHHRDRRRNWKVNFQNLSLLFHLCYKAVKYIALLFKPDKPALHSETRTCYWQYLADILALFCGTCLSV